MFPKLLKAYKEAGYPIHCGNNNCLCGALSQSNGEDAHTGGGVSLTDIAFFIGLSKVFTPSRILAIGNASGYGAFCLAEVFPTSPIDVIDAEIEGSFNKLGSELTVNISQKYYNNQINLQIGFSPEDLRLFRDNRYDFIFIDGWHSNEQQLKDYDGTKQFALNSCVIYLHDVELAKMQDSYEVIKNNKDGFNAYNVDFSTFGCKALVRNNKEVEEWLQLINQSPIIRHQNPEATLSFKK